MSDRKRAMYRELQQNLQLDAYERHLSECQHLLRQLFYARCISGTKFCDELEKWGCEDLRARILKAIEP